MSITCCVGASLFLCHLLVANTKDERNDDPLEVLQDKVLLEIGYRLHGQLGELQLATGVRSITNCHDGFNNRVQLLNHGGAFVGESIERVLAVVVAHARGANTSKGQVAFNDVHQDVVDENTTGASRVDHLLDILFVVREDVQSQRIVPRVDKLDGIIHIRDTDHGQKGSKEFVLHQLVIPVDVENDGGRDVQILLIGLSCDHNISRLVLVQDLHQTVVMTVVDDTRIVG